jgi:hypothetical protein
MNRRVLVLALLVGAVTSACCANNRKAKEAALQTALVIEAEAEYVLKFNLIDPVALATSSDGSFDKAACIEHSKMLELFKQETPALAAALRAWADDTDVESFELVEVDHEARCTP